MSEKATLEVIIQVYKELQDVGREKRRRMARRGRILSRQRKGKRQTTGLRLL